MIYLHIGNGKSVRCRDVIGIFDLDTATVGKKTRDFISGMEKSGEVEYGDDDLPRSFVLTEGTDGFKITLSRISSAGLKKRIEGKEEIL